MRCGPLGRVRCLASSLINGGLYIAELCCGTSQRLHEVGVVDIVEVYSGGVGPPQGGAFRCLFRVSSPARLSGMRLLYRGYAL